MLFFFSSRRRHTRSLRDWSSDVCSSDLDMRHPFTFPGRYSVTGGNRDYAQEMSLKAAEAHALRRAFDVTGLPTLDEQRPETPTQGGGLSAALADPEPDDSETVDGELFDPEDDGPAAA